jgi:hypothetical protein
MMGRFGRWSPPPLPFPRRRLQGSGGCLRPWNAHVLPAEPRPAVYIVSRIGYMQGSGGCLRPCNARVLPAELRPAVCVLPVRRARWVRGGFRLADRP